MNYQTFLKNELIAKVISIVNHKMKMTVSLTELLDNMSNEKVKRVLLKNETAEVTLDELEYPEVIAEALRSVGFINPSADISDIWIKHFYDKYKDIGFVEPLLQDFISWIHQHSNDDNLKMGDYICIEASKYGYQAAHLAVEIITNFYNQILSSPYNRNSKYGDVPSIRLSDLFALESPNGEGTFFDQRYIDYLNAHMEQIDNIHWAKFEQLTQEFFESLGYNVTPGKRRKDGGRDLICEKGDEKIIVQCKRQKKNVSVDTVRSIDFYLSHEDFTEGIIVSTQYATKDSKKMVEDYHLNIRFSERENVFQMIRDLSSL